MLLAIGLFCGAAILEVLLGLLPWLRLRSTLATVTLVILCSTSLAFVWARPGFITILLLVMGAYRVLNLMSIIFARINEKYLRRKIFQASAWIVSAQAITVLLWELSWRLGVAHTHVWLLVGCVNLAGSLVLLSSTIRHLRTTRPPRTLRALVASASLPTLTVAIPARNETDDLEACLRSLIASDYPKLEILVLDDCSQDKHTPEIIRSFAHDGVRFIQGVPPDDGWLAKNQAYDRLAEVANGELLLFCGVDVRFQPASLRLLVSALLAKDKSMLSVIPRNILPVGSGLPTTLVQPLRYAWELSLPRRLFRRPPVLSTCWLIKGEVLKNAGGFGAVSRSVVPESYFARVSAVHDGYTFMQADGQIGITSEKNFAEQRATAARTRFPQVHRRIELVLLLTVAELIMVIGPYLMLVAGLLGYLPLPVTLLSAMAIVGLTLTYAGVTTLTYRAFLPRSLVLLPLAVAYDVYLLNYSMIMYEFFQVEWKGRNVCIPVMRVVEAPAGEALGTSEAH